MKNELTIIGDCYDMYVEKYKEGLLVTIDHKVMYLDKTKTNDLLQFIQHTVGKSDYSTELDKVIEEEMKNKPKDIMR